MSGRKQTQSQIIGREGERWFAASLPSSWTLQKPFDDFGIDGIVGVGSDTHVSPLEFGVQIKSSKSFKFVKGRIVSPAISRDAILYWARKFTPTLVVLYDLKNHKGYCEWLFNLIDIHDIRSQNTQFYLKIPSENQINEQMWPKLQNHLNELECEFSAALRNKREILPVATALSKFLRNLCVARMADFEDRKEIVAFMTAQAWTHVEVVRELDRLIPDVDDTSSAYTNLVYFRTAYYDLCKQIYHEFDDLLAGQSAQWIMMKKLPESETTLNELTAMLAECVSGLLTAAS